MPAFLSKNESQLSTQDANRVVEVFKRLIYDQNSAEEIIKNMKNKLNTHNELQKIVEDNQLKSKNKFIK